MSISRNRYRDICNIFFLDAQNFKTQFKNLQEMVSSAMICSLTSKSNGKAEKKMKTYPRFLLKGFIYLSMLHRFTHVVLTCQRIKIFGSDMISVRFTEVLHQLQWRQLRRRIKIQLSYCTKRLSNHKKVAINIFYRLVWVPQVDRQSLVSIYFKIVSMKNYLLESDWQLINPKTEINVEDMKFLAT